MHTSTLVFQLASVTQQFDLREIAYAVIAAVIFGILVWATGIPRKVWLWGQRIRGERSFDRSTKASCERVIIVGRREGFKLDDVYVPLDLASSDLAGDVQESDERPSYPRRSFVLLGGPGAGKSTWAKHAVLNWRAGRAFFVKLRDLPAQSDFVEHVARQAEVAGIPESKKWVRSEFMTRGTLVVLDGLDEVRASDWSLVCDRVNDFYKTYAVPDTGVRLIVTCRKEAFREVPLVIPDIREVRPLTDQQLVRFAKKWPLGYPTGKGDETFLRDLRGSDRVLEVARSPLMLLGALMQYTESNLGIPDERKDYLERVARWLLEDWAKAQGHPADEWRKAYEPVLSRLAYEMHRRNTAEIPRDEGARIIRESLPKVGLDGGKAEQFIEKLATKTGILVRDTPGVLVFAQFSLQEFFASKYAASTLSPDELAALPMDWWREVVPLAVAQQQQPDKFFQALFARDPILAVSAVSEYPTPPLMYQGQAISAAFTLMDKGERGIGDAIVRLSRKVEGKHERNLIDGLEERLLQDDLGVASEAARVLARSGTSAANQALGRNYKTWDRTLRKVGYFSTSFENLLVEWIKGNDEERAEAAAAAIMSRLSDDRRDELAGILGELPQERAARIARGLIETFDTIHPSLWWWASHRMLRVACYCAAYVDRGLGPLPVESLEQPSLLAARVAGQLLKTAQTPNAALKIMLNSADWAAARTVLLWAFSSCLVVLSLGLSAGARTVALLAAVVVALGACFLGPRMVPWFPIRLPRNREIPLVFAGGGALALVLLADGYSFPPTSKPITTVLTGVVLALLALADDIEPSIRLRGDFGSGIRYLRPVLGGWVILLALLAAVLHWVSAEAITVAWSGGAFLAAVLALIIARTWGAARSVRHARDAVFQVVL